MIRVNRGDEPEAIRLMRRRSLAAAIIAKLDTKEVEFDGYDVAKDELVKRLNAKCAYCEVDLRKEGNPVEHFRPKREVRDENGRVIDRNRYWWLAWTWENLLFACTRCNTNHKKNQFPLEPRTNPLAERSYDLATEKPLLVDPAVDDPREHIIFKWSDSRGKYMPTPKSRSVRGDATIRILQLEEDDKAAAHVEERVKPIIEQIKQDANQNPPNTDNVRLTWQRWMRSLFSRGQPFHSITWDVLDREFPPSFRDAYQVELPPLGAPVHVSKAPPFDFATRDDPNEFRFLTDDRLKLEIRAMGDRTPEDVAVALLKKIEAVRPWTDAELARLFRRTPATIARWKQAAR